ncbi:N-acetyl sugar amidotransferase [Shewanella sedimentimangrovi]|uniref:N-acetyl sugar amidotransferase n=1 Tax=Shewanella sedimentimangrovi TaxID=2814293 RepID=A0ABX7QX05_9GAMM|nr:N-acetyl sugar amidotransferase [Shewanella sedimentimangrovi]QSX36031.1 N-acetyl sugar amidotransferase [Shewanella sedimentimangrovi]
MNSNVPEFVITEDGCNFCDAMVNANKRELLTDRERNSFIESVKFSGKSKPYDCIIGLSGGLDSSYALHLAVNAGLRPLAVHMDNGWNSELAQNNIANLVSALGVDLYTHVIDWDEYREMMQSFFDADVLDIELLYDNAMLAVNYQLAKKYNLKYILAGTNNATEGIPMPKGWNWYKYDKKNIQSIGSKLGNKLSDKSFPYISTLDRVIFRQFYKINWVSFLDYFQYNKETAKELLVENYKYKPYPYKHYESVFTRFYQGYILPEKFKVDKRLPHLSALVVNGQISRAEGIELLKTSPYPSERELQLDKDYFLKKMGWNEKHLEEYLKRPEVSHNAYDSEVPFNQLIGRIKSWIR